MAIGHKDIFGIFSTLFYGFWECFFSIMIYEGVLNMTNLMTKTTNLMLLLVMASQKQGTVWIFTLQYVCGAVVWRVDGSP